MTEQPLFERFPFDERKPFYPLVLTYLALKYGLRRLGSMGVNANQAKLRQDAVGRDLHADIYTTAHAEDMESLPELVQMSLVGSDESITVFKQWSDIATRIDNKSLHLAGPIHQAHMAEKMLLISAFDSAKVTGALPNKQSPVCEFFYHARNACAHNGRFKFDNIDRLNKYTAQYCGMRVTEPWAGEPLFLDFHDGKAGKIQEGDAVKLLWQVEQELGDSLLVERGYPEGLEE